jgi:ABC-type sugar transport system ATPase subunit
MYAEMDILFVNEPTRGIDVGAKEEIYSFLYDLNKQGVGIVMVSSELPEILTVSDRIVVMYEGKLNAEYSREEATREKLLKAMTGHPGEESRDSNG